MSALLMRGDSLFGGGDIASARLFYERAADAGNGQAALRLGESYDPAFLARVHLGGVRGNVSAAIFWYQRAGDLGMSEADLLLGSLQAK
jgi:TPR repeat protein